MGRGDGDDRTVIIAGGIGDATSQATMQVMNRFLNRLPTITIREGHRVKVYLTSDLELPAYVAPTHRSEDRRTRCSVDTLVGTGSGADDGDDCSGAAGRDRPGQPVPDDPDCRADLAALPGAAPAIRNHPADVSRARATWRATASRRSPSRPTIRAAGSTVGPWIQALNSGDATGAAYLSTALPLLRPTTTPAALTAAARRTLERQYATIEIADSVAMMAGHQVALSRGYHGRLQTRRAVRSRTMS